MRKNIFYQTPPPAPPTEAIPDDTIVTMDVENQEIPLLMGHLIQDAAILDHPQVQQINPVPDTELDKELDMEMSLQPNKFIESDPNLMKDDNHLLRPLANKAALLDNQETVRKPCKIRFETIYRVNLSGETN